MNQQPPIEAISIYQVYPRSFFDTNDDGIGDLQGISSKLDYVADLGVDYLWISPFFTSPMLDFGYDVSDYKDVDPIFGDLASFDALMNKADKLGLKIMLDMVLAHSSDIHPWFKESCINSTNSKHDWYIWVDAKDPQQKPNNWLSVFGGSAWTYHPTKKQFYLHKFLKSQPNLNFFNPEVQEAALDVCKFWLDKGVKGMRLDTVNFYFHDQQLRNNPLIEDNLTATDAPSVNPYIKQNHIYDKNRPENVEFLKKLRSLSDSYQAILLGEVGEAYQASKIIKEYTAGNDKLHLCYSFSFIGGPLDANYFADTVNDFWDQAPESMTCNSFGNHDSTRLVSRWPHNTKYNDAFTKMCCSLLLCLKGAYCVYQGEELGLSEYDIKKDELQDPYGLEFYPDFKGRDGCRTPFVWQKDAVNGGFSKAQKCWLPVASEHLALAVDQHQDNPDSLLNFYRKFIKFHKNNSQLQNGDIKATAINQKLLQIDRANAEGAISCIFNFSDETQTIKNADRSILIAANYKASQNQLKPYGFVIFTK